MVAHWGGPVKYIDISRATPRIILSHSEKKAIINELNNKLSEEDIVKLFDYLELREIVDIDFEDK
jgi:hypothetical protein